MKKIYQTPKIENIRVEIMPILAGSPKRDNDLDNEGDGINKNPHAKPNPFLSDGSDDSDDAYSAWDELK